MNSQEFWENQFNEALKNMNYGNGGFLDQSGERNVFEYVKANSTDEHLTIFDVGANIGIYTQALSDSFKDRATIHCFEPSSKAYHMLVKNTKHLNHVIHNNIGFSDNENTQTLFTNVNASGLASLYKRRLDHFDIYMDKQEEVKLSTIDSYCRSNNVNHIHFLKLDIEGHEIKALNGAKDMINGRKIDFIQFEFGGCNIDSRTYFQDFYYLLKDNYRICRVLQDGLHDLGQYKETYEIFVTINYLAIKK